MGQRSVSTRAGCVAARLLSEHKQNEVPEASVGKMTVSLILTEPVSLVESGSTPELVQTQ